MKSSTVRLIDAMIVGAEKAGTTSLANYLGSHPDICTHEKREFNYFVVDSEYSIGYEAAYERYFAACGPETHRLIGKSVAVCTTPNAIRRLYEHNPEMLVVFVLRNPIDRAYSAYWYSKRRGWEDAQDFETAITREMQCETNRESGMVRSAYLKNGMYTAQIELLQSYFGKSRVLIFTFERLKRSPESICQEVFSRLGVDDRYAIDTSKRFNESAKARSEKLAMALSHRGKYKKYLRRMIPRKLADTLKKHLVQWNEVPLNKPVMNEDTRQLLMEHYKPEIDKLRKLVGSEILW